MRRTLAKRTLKLNAIEKAIKADVVSENMLKGNYDRAFYGMIDSVLVFSNKKEAAELEKYREVVLRKAQKIRSSRQKARFFANEMIQFQPIIHQNVVNKSRKNFTTIYRKTGLIPDATYNLKDVTVTGKPTNFELFEKARTREQAVQRIDEVVNLMNRNFRLNKMSMERLI